MLHFPTHVEHKTCGRDEVQLEGGDVYRKPAVSQVDLDVIRETLSYIRDDMRRVPGLEKAVERLSATLREISAAESRRLSPLTHSLIKVRLPLRRKH